MLLRPGELALMQQVVLQLTGVALDDSKGYLVETRLGPVAARRGLANFNELYFQLRYARDKELLDAAIDAITTHETSFFRDSSPFDALQFKLLPESIDARERLGQRRRLRIWSAACSTGQEPYSIGMVIHDLLGSLAGWDIEILATDISEPTILGAQRAVYSESDVRRTTRPQCVGKYFERVEGGYRVVEKIRKMVKWRKLNLLEPLALLGQFDIVFLRNVLIYFEAEQRRTVVNRVANQLLPHGWLVVGGSENLSDVGPNFRPETHCRAIVYQPRMAPVGAR